MKRAIAIKKGCLCLLLGLSLGLPLLASGNDDKDPFQSYRFTMPSLIEMMSTNVDRTGSIPTVTDKLTFKSRGNINTVYAIVSYPEKKGKYPALLILHGGGGNAEGLQGMVKQYAQQGYVAMAIDQPGICGMDNTPNSDGPWKTKPGGEGPRFEIGTQAANSTLTDAIIADLQAFNWLANRTDVDKERVGITGFSWGGYSTTMLAGLLGSRVKAAYTIYGCGFYDKDSFWTKILADLPTATRHVWLKYLDAGRRAPAIKAPYFVEAASNDTYFQPTAVMATLAAIPGTKNHVWGPNLNHKRLEEGSGMQQQYFDHYLKGVGEAFYTVGLSKAQQFAQGHPKVDIHIGSSDAVKIQYVRLYYSKHAADWAERVWESVEAKRADDGSYIASLPANLARGLSYYAYAVDSLHRAVASEMMIVP